MPIFIIETESRFKLQYAVEADTFDKAFELIESSTQYVKTEKDSLILEKGKAFVLNYMDETNKKKLGTKDEWKIIKI